MNEILIIFISLSISGSLTAVILFALRQVLKDRLSKAWQYYIWLAVIIRLLVPVSAEINIVGRMFSVIDEQTSAQNFFPPEPANMVDYQPNNTYEPTDDIPPRTEDFSPSPATQTQTAPAKTPDYWIELRNSIWLLWLVPAVMLLVRKVTGYRSFVRYIRAGIDETTDFRTLAVYQSACMEAGLKRPLGIYTNKLAVSPMLVGIFRPFVVLPESNLGDDDLYNIFIHELTHYRRLDIFYKWLVQLAVCLHWYNPLVYLISREINKSCELSCDETIIRLMDNKGKRSYGDTLLASLVQNGSYGDTVASVTLNEDAKLLKERLSAIMKFKNKSKLTTVLSAVLTIAVICVTLITGAYAATDIRPGTEGKEYTDSVETKVYSANSSDVILIDYGFLPIQNNALTIRPILKNNTPYELTTVGAEIVHLDTSGSSVRNSAISAKAGEEFSFFGWELPAGVSQIRFGITSYTTSDGKYHEIAKDNVIRHTLYAYDRLIFEGGVGAGDTRFGSPFIAGKGDIVTLTLDKALMAWQADSDELLLNIDIGGNSGTTQVLVLSNKEPSKSLEINEYATHHITISNPNKQLVEYSFILDVKPKQNEAIVTAPPNNTQIPENYNKADNAAIKIMQYSGSWEVSELLIPNMSKTGIDRLTEIYNQKNQYSGANKKNPADYYDIDGTDPTDADARALTMMQKNGMWEYTEPLFPYMTNKGIDNVVALYNQKHQNSGGIKSASDYYNTEAPSVPNTVIDLSNKNSFSIAESGGFSAKTGQKLTLDINSTVKGGNVNLFLFDPAGNEHRVTIGYTSMTQEIELSEGSWQYNCSGNFKDGGNIRIIGTVTQ